MRDSDVEKEVERMTDNRMVKGLEIDFDTADRITLLNLMDQRKYLVKELNDYKEGRWLHPEDVVRNAEIIAALELLIPYYGGTND
jgi:hypothetical protein